MKRWVLRAILCLFLGAITTVGLALAVAQFGGSRLFSEFAGYDESRAWEEFDVAIIDHVVDTEGDIFHSICNAFTSPGAIWRFHYAIDSFPGGSFKPFDLLVVGEFGWPYRALGYVRSDSWVKTDRFRHHNLDWLEANLRDDEVREVRYALDGSVGRPIPDQLLAGGFVTNTLFYAAIWFGVFFGFASAKRAIRRRRGRCPMCGYDLRGQRHEGTPGEARRHEGQEAGCPECGWGREEEQTKNQRIGETK
jgi:hypothetical protein